METYVIHTGAERKINDMLVLALIALMIVAPIYSLKYIKTKQYPAAIKICYRILFDVFKAL